MPTDDRPIKDVHSYLLDLDDSYGQVWSWFNSQLIIIYIYLFSLVLGFLYVF